MTKNTKVFPQSGDSTISRFDTICVIGLGYIGLPTAAMFASKNIKVIGVDTNPIAVEVINCGEIHIFEPGLETAVSSAVQQGYLRATSHPEPADAFLIAVPTPFKGENHEPDLSYIEAASIAIAPVLKEGNLIVLESTSPVGATEEMADWLARERPDLSFPQQAGENSDIRIAYCPERVLPGKVLRELVSNDRVIGGMTPHCSELAAQLYRTFVSGDCVIATEPRVAEMAKLTENSFRDVNIAFANELSVICDKLGIDVWELIRLSNRHPRVSILQPGPGVGGHCIAVDPWFIVWRAPNETRLIRTARGVNDGKPQWVVEKVRAAIGAFLVDNPDRTASEVSVAVYGLSFKPDTDDLRGSPALSIARRISDEHHGSYLIVEPNAEVLPAGLGSAELVSLEVALSSDVHVMLVAHTVFRAGATPRTSYRVDTCNVWDN